MKPSRSGTAAASAPGSTPDATPAMTPDRTSGTTHGTTSGTTRGPAPDEIRPEAQPTPADAAEATSRCIDKLVNLDVNGRGAIDPLYAAVLDRYGQDGTALSALAARLLVERVGRGDSVLFLTGFPELPWFDRGLPETDGPVGTAVLARALIRGLGAVPVIPIEAHFAGVVRAALLGAGLQAVEGDATTLPRMHPGDPVVLLHVTDPDVDVQAAFEGLRPAAVIAIERPGANDKGTYHHMSGRNIDHCLDPLETFFTLADERGLLTLAIGDGGNEVGMGGVADTVRRSVAHGSDCGCGCGGGIAASSTAELIVSATVANWGATAVAAALAMRLGDRRLLPAPGLELRSLDHCAAAGGVDGAHAGSLPSADGVPRDVYANVLGVISHLTDKAMGVDHEYL